MIASQEYYKRSKMKTSLLTPVIEAKEEFAWDAKETKNKVLDYDWLLPIQEKKPSNGVAPKNKVLLLTYPRSGSTYTGSVLSASQSVAYFMEPIFSLLPVGEADWDYFLESAITNNDQVKPVIQKLMEGLYSCNEAVLERMNILGDGAWTSVTVKASVFEECSEAKTVLVKTIRLHKDNMDWIQDSDVKVVHLVRDPRGMIGSMLQQPEEWTTRLGSYKGICSQMETDLELEKSLAPGNYLRVRYEDLVDNPVETFGKICEFSGIDFNDDVRRKIDLSSSGEKNDPKSSEYYSTVRSKNFKHDSWKKKMNKETIAQIECDCKDLMDKLKYNKF